MEAKTRLRPGSAQSLHALVIPMLTIRSVVSACLALSAPPLSDLFPNELASARGFSTVGERDFGRVLRNPADPSSGRYEQYYLFRARHHTFDLELVASGVQALDTEEHIRNGNATRRATGYTLQVQRGRTGCPSGLSAGLAAYSITDARRYSKVIIDGHFEYVETEVRFRGSGNPDSGTAGEIEGLVGVIEASARILLARVVGRRLAGLEPTVLGDDEVRSQLCKFGQLRYFDLAEWAAARGWTVGKPDSLPSVTLTKEGREVLLPLAAMQARLDGEWRELGDCVAEKDGRWLVPATIDDLAK
jgi:hypothetical protein